ncbi:MAG: hypothetical protein U0792_18715 [Gemmataceae bacterium]
MTRIKWLLPVVVLWGVLLPAGPVKVLAVQAPKATPKPKAGPITKPVRDRWKLDTYYAKYATAGELVVVGSNNVDDGAIVVAADTVSQMLSCRPDLLKVLVAAQVRVAVIGKDEKTTDLPEYAELRTKADFWNKRSRGLGATAAAPASSVGEENLLGLAGDRYKGESILVHEFAHTFHTMALNAVDRKFEPRLKEAYTKAMKKGLWEKTYAAIDYIEYWAEGVQSYFDANLASPTPDGIHNDIATRDALKKYDPDLYELIDTTLKSPKWKWTPPAPHAKEPAGHGPDAPAGVASTLRDYHPGRAARVVQ